MIARLLILMLLMPLHLFGDAEQDITDVVSSLASALSEGSPQNFLRELEPGMPDYRRIEHDLNALAGDTEISCSVEIIGNSGSGAAQQAELDWYMVLRSQQDQNLIERRRTKVTIRMERRGKKWMVTGFSPVSVFAPMITK